MNEIWKDIKGYEGYYQISNCGRVKSLERTAIAKCNSIRRVPEKILSICNDKDGYNIITLTKNSKKKTFKIHRLISQYFIRNPKNKPEVNHKDGNKQNNNINNLEWATESENTTHAHKIGLIDEKGEKNPNSKLSKNQVIQIKKELKTPYWGIGVSLAKKFNVSVGMIKDINVNRTWKHINV